MSPSENLPIFSRYLATGVLLLSNSGGATTKLCQRFSVARLDRYPPILAPFEYVSLDKNNFGFVVKIQAAFHNIWQFLKKWSQKNYIEIAAWITQNLKLMGFFLFIYFEKSSICKI